MSIGKVISPTVRNEKAYAKVERIYVLLSPSFFMTLFATGLVKKQSLCIAVIADI